MTVSGWLYPDKWSVLFFKENVRNWRDNLVQSALLLFCFYYIVFFVDYKCAPYLKCKPFTPSPVHLFVVRSIQPIVMLIFHSHAFQTLFSGVFKNLLGIGNSQFTIISPLYFQFQHWCHFEIIIVLSVNMCTLLLLFWFLPVLCWIKCQCSHNITILILLYHIYKKNFWIVR